MKIIIALLLLVTAAESFALEADSSKNLSDLLFVPKEGHLYGQTKMEWAQVSMEADFGVGDLDIDARINTLSQFLGYGLTDRWQVRLGYSNQLSGLTTIEDNGNSESTGAQNPEIGTLYRVLKQEDDSITLDALISYSPDLFDSESNSAKNTNDAASGGSSFSFGGRAGKKFTSVEMMGELIIRVNGSSETKDTATNAKSKTDANVDTVLAYSAQFPLTEEFWLRGRIETNMSGETKSKDGSGDTTKTDATRATSVAGSLLYSPIKDHLVLEAGLALLGAADYKSKTTGSPTTKYENVGGSMLMLSATYQF